MRSQNSDGPSARQLWRWLRIVLLLLVLGVVLLRYQQASQAENWVSDWASTEAAAVVLLVPPGPSEDERELVADIQRYAEAGEGDATYDALQDWFRREYVRFRPERAGFKPLSLIVREPRETSALPPNPPRAGTDAIERTRAMQAFLSYFDELEAQRAVPERNAIYVVFYPESAQERFAHVHSIADRRSRRGFVFAPLTEEGRDLAVIDTAHELLHLFGADDKYEGGGCSFPEGYYEPFRDPVHPQRFAEVMALGIPIAPGDVESSNFSFDEVRVGTATAREIGWIEPERAERYYAQKDLAAGPQAESE